MNKDILVLALTSGEQLIAEVSENSGAYICTNVLQILVDGDSDTGQVRVGFIPYLPFCDLSGGVAIPTHMAIVAIPGASMLERYNTKFGNIITPTPQKIFVG